MYTYKMMQWFWHIPARPHRQHNPLANTRDADSHAIVVVDTTWLLRNFCRLRMLTSTPWSASGSRASASSAPCVLGSCAV